MKASSSSGDGRGDPADAEPADEQRAQHDLGPRHHRHRPPAGAERGGVLRPAHGWRSCPRRRSPSPRRGPQRRSWAARSLTPSPSLSARSGSRARARRQPLVGGEHLDPVALADVPGVAGEAVDRVVACGRVVVEQRQALGAGLAGDADRVVDRAVAPVGFAANSAGVYWASWISRSTPSHSSSTPVGDVERPSDGLLVVADVGDATPPSSTR